MLEEDLIKNFKYNGFDISKLNGNIHVVDTDSRGIVYNEVGKQVIATTNTFSCANILVYNDNFAYLVHMLPTETIGSNDKFSKRVIEIKDIIKENKYKEVNILISLGESISSNPKLDFHNLDYVNYQINDLVEFCNLEDVTLNQIPTLKSKFLLFDFINKEIYIDNEEKKVIKLEQLNMLKSELTIKSKKLSR